MTTPLRGRRGHLRVPINLDSDSDVSINDDNAEKLQRRQDKVLELARSSPKRLSNVHGMSNSLLVEHYTNCMKLSTENKITIKNAFGLHLIDYMAEMIRKKDSQFDNFQVASCTLDASAKIYSYRVDCVHADTMKIVSGLSRSEENKSKRKNEGAEPIEDEVNEDEPAKKKRIKRGRTIEVNLKNINTTKLDMQSEIDPILQNISKKFLQDGSSAVVFLTSLCHYNQDYGLKIDSHKEFEHKPVPGHFGSVPVPINDLKPFFKSVVKENNRICIAFDGLELGKCDSSDQRPDIVELNGKFDETVYNNSFAETRATDDYIDSDPHLSYNDVNTIEDNQPSKTQSTVFDEINSNGKIMQALSLEPSEYSYFKPQFLTAWAGPNHWHIHPRPKGTSVDGTKTTRVTRTKKPQIEIDFKNLGDVFSLFKKSRTSMCLSKTTLQNWNEDNTTLPENTYYEDKMLFKLFLNKQIALMPHNSVIDQNVYEKGDYNYDNANDVDNYCPSSDLHDDNPDDMNDDRMSPITQPENELDMDYGENLIAKPFQVPKFEIPYPRAAKKINVKHVKSCMWDWISENTTNVDADIKTFREMYAVLPDLVTPQTAKNLSPAIAFTCLLHLANEKILKIVSNEKYTNLTIEIENQESREIGEIKGD